MDKILSVKDLCKSYNGNLIINNVSISVEKGDFLSILGNSGAGKSTLLYLLAGIEKPDKGMVFLDNTDINKATDREMSKIRSSKMGFVFQFDNLFSDLSVIDNILLPGIISGRKKSDLLVKAKELMEYMGISNIQNNKPSEISGGEQQRVAIARAMITDPEILFLDEPTGSLNSEAGNQIMALILRLNKEKQTTVVQVTHNLLNAEVGNRIIIIKDGAIIEQSKVKQETEN